MKNSTQITFAFQDSPDPGENPGVGVRIKSLKKGPNDSSSTDGTGEKQPQINSQPEKPAEPNLFDETLTNQEGLGTVKSEPEDQTPAGVTAKTKVQSEAEPPLQSGAQPQSQSGAEPQTQSEAETQFQSEAETQLQSEAARQSQSGAEPQAQTEGDIQRQGLAQINPNSDNLPQASIKNKSEEDNKVEDKNVNRESTNPAEHDNALVNAQGQNEDDADIPVFRGSSLSAAFPVSGENETRDPVTDSNEIESREVDELDDNNGGTDKAAKSTRGRKSLKTIEEGTELINIPPDEVLFQKQYYAIGEVAEMFHVNQSLLRFWETEFDIIQPRKNRKGDRHFRPIDIKNLLLIHDLLRRRKLTIEGAKDFLKKNKRSPERFAMIQSLQKIKGFILEIKATL